MHRLAPTIAVVCAALVLPSAAAAATTFRFHAGAERARVSVSDGRSAQRGYVELVRGGVVIARSLERNGLGAAGGHLKLPSLVAGDVVNAYGNDALFASATYDGRPAIAGACDGRSSFTVTRDERARTTWVGVLPSGRRLLWQDASVFRVAAEPALTAGETASVVTTRGEGATTVIARRDERVGRCRAVPPPARVPPTSAKLRTATRRAVRTAGARLRRARLAAGKRVTVRVRCIEPGSVRLELKAGRVVVGSGVETVAEAGRAKVTVALTGNLERARRLTLSATFVPARAGAKPHTARTRIRL